MPSIKHEVPIDFMRHVPDLVPQILDNAAAGSVPKYVRARCDASEATTTSPPEFRADLVVVLERNDGEKMVPAQAVIVECQLGRDPVKRYSWPVYVTNIRARLRCPVVLLVLTATESIARWCAEPIDAGGGYLTHRPLACTLTSLPPVTTPEQARAQPAYTALSAIVNHERDPSVLNLLLHALDALDPEETALYADYVLKALPAEARMQLGEMMKLYDYEFETDLVGRPYKAGREEGRDEGRTEALAGAILDVLEAREIHVDSDTRARITECADLDQLKTWHLRALTISSASDLFA